VGTRNHVAGRTDLPFKVIDDALAAGYRLFDSVYMYEDEKWYGEAFKEYLPKHNLTRSDIFIQSTLCK
jgi:diketogulonate reductase-like aldo/keto reductase